MAIVSTHTLNSVDGTHAGGIAVQLFRLDDGAWRTTVFETATDEGGRLSETIAAGDVDTDPDGSYHIPFILSPSGFSVWCSRV